MEFSEAFKLDFEVCFYIRRKKNIFEFIDYVCIKVLEVRRKILEISQFGILICLCFFFFLFLNIF